MARTVTFGRLGTWWAGPIPASWHRMTFAKDSQPEEITFRLSGQKHQFDTKDPIWAQKDTGSCPPKQGLHKDIEVVSCSDRELTVRNRNEDAATLRYQLNVLDARSNQGVPIDPIMENGGRTTS